MRIYVASSWRNTRQPVVVKALRKRGHEVYDFRDNATSFDWRAVATAKQLKSARKFRDEILFKLAGVHDAYLADMNALRTADATVLVLPCGRSAHLELGFAVANGQKTVVLLDDPLSEPEIMYLAASNVCVTLREVTAQFPRVKGRR